MSSYLSKRLGRVLKNRRLRIATAESCTGGLLAKVITDIGGASEYFELGLVTYSDIFKSRLLGVRRETLRRYGAVSENTVKEMASGLKRLSGADICVSISGIAGPSGGSSEKPLGTVYFGILIGNRFVAIKKRFYGNRRKIRDDSIRFILKEILRRVEEEL